jgi:hypothetical protein
MGIGWIHHRRTVESAPRRVERTDGGGASPSPRLQSVPAGHDDLHAGCTRALHNLRARGGLFARDAGAVHHVCARRGSGPLHHVRTGGRLVAGRRAGACGGLFPRHGLLTGGRPAAGLRSGCRHARLGSPCDLPDSGGGSRGPGNVRVLRTQGTVPIFAP